MPGLSNKEVAEVFREMETLLLLLGGEEQRAMTFGRVARILEALEPPAADLAVAGRLTEVKGIGPASQRIVAELADRGSARERDELAARVPPGVLEMLRVPGLGPKRIRQIVAELGATSLAELERAIADGRLAALKGFGEKSAGKIGQGIAFVRSTLGRCLLPEAIAHARALGVAGAEPAGGIRRGDPVVDEIVLVAEGEGEERIAAEGDRPPVRIRRAPKALLARVLFEETGPAEHVAKVLARPGTDATEEEIYRSRGLFRIPPERRWALDGTRAPEPLVDRGQVRGLVHAHTTWSDGALPIEAMAEAARARGFAYLALSDHSRSAAYANGLSIERVRRQADEIRAWNAKERGFRVLHGVEADILPDGSLDYPDDLLASLDFVIASVHSSFGQDRETMTARIVRAVRHPEVDILGHPTGRLLLRRGGYAVDMDAVLAAAAEARCAIELNAHPLRLDLDAALHERARSLGIRVPICPDAHDAEGMDDVAWGVVAARRGGLAAADVPNCLDADAFLEAL